MLWLSVAILPYFLSAFVKLIDKSLLSHGEIRPKIYVFYVGMLGMAVFILSPWVGFPSLQGSQLLLSMSAGAAFACGLFWFYEGLRLFEVSRIVPAIGAATPLFTLIIIFFATQGHIAFTLFQFLPLFLLLIGSVFITWEKEKAVTMRSLKIAAIAAFLFSLSFVLTKYVYLAQPFWSGFMTMRLGGLLIALLLFIFSREVKEMIRGIDRPRITLLFVFNQLMGAGASLLQNFAIALAPLAMVVFITAVQGIEYVFLLGLSILISFRFPRMVKEEISTKAIFRKFVAILLIGAGLAILTFKSMR